MRRSMGFCLVLFTGVVACSGSTGPAGPAGPAGAKGAPGVSASTPEGGVAASISAISPSHAFQDRTIDISISGSGTTWDAKTQVAFANPMVTVNKVTVASAAALVANVTIAASAAVGPTTVTVTDGSETTTFVGAFEIGAPLTVTVTPATGLPQGGLANLHVQMNDLTTPIDPDTFAATVSSPDITVNLGSPSDYAFDATLQADVLSTPGIFDLSVTFGATTTITSVAPQSFKLTTRAPTALKAGSAANGMIATELDTELYEFTPATATQQFVQFSSASMAGSLSTTVIPKSGQYADAITSYAMRYAKGITSTDAFYLVVGDSNSLFGAGPVPADSEVSVFVSPCTALNEMAETSASNDDGYKTAQVVTTLPALVSGTLGYGTVDPTVDVDVYEITAPAGSTKIHVATGGDPFDDAVVSILDATGVMLAMSDDSDLQQDLVFTVSTAGTYYVSITASTSGNFQASDNTYQLFVAAD